MSLYRTLKRRVPPELFCTKLIIFERQSEGRLLKIGRSIFLTRDFKSRRNQFAWVEYKTKSKAAKQLMKILWNVD